MQLSSLFALLAAATLAVASPRPVPKECTKDNMVLHAGHGHKDIIKAVCSNANTVDLEAAAAKGKSYGGSAPKAAKGSAASPATSGH